jgi:hypothetical protein
VHMVTEKICVDVASFAFNGAMKATHDLCYTSRTLQSFLL